VGYVCSGCERERRGEPYDWAASRRYCKTCVSRKEEVKIAVLIPAHNEEAVIDGCLRCATREVGQEHVYLVSDNSTDRTASWGRDWTRNVLEVKRGGKAQAVRAGVKHFALCERYDAVLVVDADSLLLPGVLDHYRDHFAPETAAVIGRPKVLSDQRGLIAAWRRHQYFWLNTVYLQGAAAYGGGFPVTPGFCTAYATRALERFEHDAMAPTEDIDYCWQVHRRRLGSIVYAPGAVVETAVPVGLRDYLKQILRWHRGWHYATRKHRLLLGFQPVDFVAGLMMAEMMMVWLRLLVLAILVVSGLSLEVSDRPLELLLALSFAIDAGILFLLGATRSRRLGAIRRGRTLPYVIAFPAMFWLDQFVNIYAAATLRRGLKAVWTPPKRREEVRT